MLSLHSDSRYRVHREKVKNITEHREPIQRTRLLRLELGDACRTSQNIYTLSGRTGNALVWQRVGRTIEALSVQ